MNAKQRKHRKEEEKSLHEEGGGEREGQDGQKHCSATRAPGVQFISYISEIKY